jgi:nucleotide sugar dehydrogenase
MPEIAIVGLGFVGLTTGLCLAEKGHSVRGVDRDAGRMETIRRGKIPFHEPHLLEALGRHLGQGFRLAADSREALSGADAVFICVGTPGTDEGGANLSFVVQAAREAAEHSSREKYPVVVVKSTVPPGSTAGPVYAALEESGRRIGGDIGLAVAPEFLREGHAWEDSVNPDRVVVGAVDDRAGEILELVLGCFSAPVRLVSATEAEFIKYLSNTLLATLISFSNEQAMLARKIGDIDIARAFGILHEDKRWRGEPAAMTSYAFPGCGFGGYCLPKDTAALRNVARDHGMADTMLESVLRVNRQARADAAERIAAASDPLAPIGVLGLSFKPGSDDVRDSPAADIIGRLIDGGRKNIVAHDPMAMAAYAGAFKHPIRYRETAEQVVAECGTVAILAAWPEYRALDYAGKRVLDCRYCLPPGVAMEGWS